MTTDNADQVREKVISITADKLKIEIGKINQHSKFINDLGVDSLAFVELVMAFEEEFGCSITEEDANKLHSIDNVVECILSKRN